MATKLTSVANMSVMALITCDSIGTKELGQSFRTDMTKAAMPKGGGRRGSSEGGGGGAGWCQRKERVKISRAITPGDHAPCL